MAGTFKTWMQRALRTRSQGPYILRRAPDALPTAGAMGLALWKTYAWPETSVLGVGSAFYGAPEAVSSTLIVRGPVGVPTSLGQITLDDFMVDPGVVGPWAG